MDYLIYVPNDSKYSYVEGTTRLAKLLDKYTSKDTGETTYDFEILTDSGGGFYKKPYVYVATADSVVSARKVVKPVDNMSIFQPLNQSGKLVASFYTKSDSKDEKSIAKTMNYPLGSGIYGWFISKGEYASDIIGDVAMAEIKIKKPYLIQDKEHLNSLIQASNLTNVFLDKIKLFVASSDFIEVRAPAIDKALSAEGDEVRRLHLLWNIAFMRTGHSFDVNTFYQTLFTYLAGYTGADSYFDLSNYAYPLPINFIMMDALGVTGIIVRRQDNNLYGINSLSFKVDRGMLEAGKLDILVTRNDY